MTGIPLYLIIYTVLFWVPAALFAVLALRAFPVPLKRAFWATSVVMGAASVVNEYIFLKYDVWFFSEKIDRLVGLRLFGAPVEEFVFWFGATPFCLALYLMYGRMFKKNA